MGINGFSLRDGYVTLSYVHFDLGNFLHTLQIKNTEKAVLCRSRELFGSHELMSAPHS